MVGGNYVVAKRRGIVDGVDFGHTGEVKHCCHIHHLILKVSVWFPHDG